MKHWLKRALLTTALASGALIISAGVASAAPDGEIPVDPEAIIAQTQQALNDNETRQDANSLAETIQVNVYAPVAVLSHQSNGGDVDQSNEAETTAAASNSNETEQKVDQDQAAKVEADPCAKCEPSGGVDQSQTAGNTNTTDQGAEATAETRQVNVYAPVAVLSHGANGGDVDQSNEAETTAVAANSNDTEQSIAQDQAAEVEAGDGQSCGDCSSGGEVDQSQTGANSNRTAQQATAEAKTDQANEVEGGIYSLLPVHDSKKGQDDAGKHGYHGKDEPEVDQSNKGVTTAVAANDNEAKQSIDQDQAAEVVDRTKAHGIDRPKGDHNEDRDDPRDDHKERDHEGRDHKDRDHKDRDHKDRDHKDRDHKERDHKERDHKERDPKDRDPKDRDPKERDHKDRDHKDRDHKQRDPKDRDSKDRDPKDRDPKERDHKERDHKERDHKDRDPKDRDPKDRDPKDRDPKDRDHKDRGHKGGVEPGKYWPARGGGVTQSQTAGNDNATEQSANATAKTRQLNLYAPVALLSPGSNNGDVDQSNRAETTSGAANDNATAQRTGQLQNALRAV